jgi:hypothetical protein
MVRKKERRFSSRGDLVSADMATLPITQAVSASWDQIRPEVEKAIAAKMKKLGLPALPEQKTACNHYHGNAVGVIQSFFYEYMDAYMTWLFAEQIGYDPNVKKAKIAVVEKRVNDFYTRLSESVQSNGNLETARIDPATPASKVISAYADAGSPADQDNDLLHLTMDTGFADVTKCALDAQFRQAIELDGGKVMLAYLKREYGMTTDVNIADYPDVPAKPDIKPLPKGSGGLPGRRGS